MKAKSFLYLLPLFFALALTVLVYKGLLLPTPYEQFVKVDKPIPKSLKIEKTPSLINVFASWCRECELEMPLLLGLSSRIPIYGLNYWDENAESWLQEHGNPYEKVIYDPKGLISSQLSVVGVPETFLVGKDGVIKTRIIGQIDSDMVDQVIIPWIEGNGILR